MYRDNCEGLGTITWWGLSPAIDLFEKCDKISKDDKINVLTIGVADTRHILQTVGNILNDNIPKIKFFVVENNVELIARQSIQLYLIGCPNNELGLQDKTEIFLELFGNSLTRDATETWLNNATAEMIQFATGDGCFQRFSPLININTLKFKDRDLLESIFKMWCKKNKSSFEISTYWNSRVRKHLGTRYDAIPNVFDWDCTITLHDRGASTMESREYGNWRKTGIAFKPRHASYLTANRTLASPRAFNTPSGDRTALMGYWGDIICSPYLAFGLDTSKCPELTRKHPGGRIIYGASLIAEVNLRRLIWQISHGAVCPASIASITFGVEENTSKQSKVETAVEEDDDDEKESNSCTEEVDASENKCDVKNENDHEEECHMQEKIEKVEESMFKENKKENITSKKDDNTIEKMKTKCECEELANVPNMLDPSNPKDKMGFHNLCNCFEVHFLPTNSFPDLPIRMASRFAEPAQKLDIVYVACSMVHLLTSSALQIKKESVTPNSPDYASNSLLDLVTENCLLIIESCLFIVDIRPEQIKAYVEKSTKMAADVGFQPFGAPDPLKDHHLYFKRKPVPSFNC